MGYTNSGLRGYLAGAGAVTFYGNVTMASGAKLKLDTSTSTTDCPLQFNGDPNNGLRHGGADVSWIVQGGVDVLAFQSTAVTGGVAFNASAGFTANTSASILSPLTLSSYLALTQIAAPSAPTGTVARVYAVDSGASKNRVAVIFDTGAAQTVATEP